MKTPLYNHNSLETAYLIEDYPYGRLRCRMKAWLEYREGKGFRYCTQTENPKNLRWNAIKHSTYMLVACNMYINSDNGHCEWEGVSEYTDHDKALQFVKDFPETNVSVLLPWTLQKIAYYKMLVDGTAHFTMNNVKQEPSEYELEEYKKDHMGWNLVLAAIGNMKKGNKVEQYFDCI
jgi:hypothetical protein